MKDVKPYKSIEKYSSEKVREYDSASDHPLNQKRQNLDALEAKASLIDAEYGSKTA